MIFHGLPCFVDSWGPLRRNIKQPQRHIQRARSHFGSGPQPLPSRCPRACVSQAGYKMFSVARLEGRALEHAIAGNSGCHVRMLDKRKRPVLIRSEEAKAARKYMRARYSTLQADLLKRGCSCRGGDRVVKLAQSDAKRLGQEQVSVDLLLLCGYGYALVEAKWSRRSLQGSLDFGMKCLPKLRAGGHRGGLSQPSWLVFLQCPQVRGLLRSYPLLQLGRQPCRLAMFLKSSERESVRAASAIGKRGEELRYLATSDGLLGNQEDRDAGGGRRRHSLVRPQSARPRAPANL